jgi:DNA-binding CsgD family transcriptional regulator
MKKQLTCGELQKIIDKQEVTINEQQKLIEIKDLQLADYRAKCPFGIRAVNRMPAGICHSSLQGYGVQQSLHLVYFNSGMRRLLEYPELEFYEKGDGIYEAMIDEKDHHCITDTIAYLQQHPNESYLSMCRMKTRSGEELTSLIISCRLSRHNDGRLNEILSVGIPFLSELHNYEVLEAWMKLQKQLLHKDIVGKLTCQQKVVVQLRVNGYIETEIAEKLFISEQTVRTHFKDINKVLGVHNIQQLIRLAVTCGLN